MGACAHLKLSGPEPLVNQNIGGLPRIATKVTATPRIVFRDGQVTGWKSGGGIIGALSRDPGNTGDVNVLRPGLLMGKQTSDGYWYPSIFGVTTGAYSAGGTSLTVATGVGSHIIDRIGATGTLHIVGPPAANGVVAEEDVTYSAIAAGTITITALLNDYVSGAFIQPADGSEIIRSVIPDGWGINMFDTDMATAIAQPWPNLPLAGVITMSQLLPAWPSDTSLRAWLTNMLCAGGGAGLFIADTEF